MDKEPLNKLIKLALATTIICFNLLVFIKLWEWFILDPSTLKELNIFEIIVTWIFIFILVPKPSDIDKTGSSTIEEIRNTIIVGCKAPALMLAFGYLLINLK